MTLLAAPSTCMTREFISNALRERNIESLSGWFYRRKRWTAENIDRLRLDSMDQMNDREILEWIPYKICVEAIQLRDFDLIGKIPKIVQRDYRREIVQILTHRLVKEPQDDLLLSITIAYFRENSDSPNYLPYLVEKAASMARVDLLKKLIPILRIPVEITREYVHFPFDQSVGTKDPNEKEKFRLLITLLNPHFEMPAWLIKNSLNSSL